MKFSMIFSLKQKIFTCKKFLLKLEYESKNLGLECIFAESRDSRLSGNGMKIWFTLKSIFLKRKDSRSSENSTETELSISLIFFLETKFLLKQN